MFLTILLFLLQCSSQKSSIEQVMPPKREFRGVWIASVANIDYPTKKTLSSAEQKREFINIMDNHQRLGINAVLVQVRAASDALYAKSFEPWSEWLTGTQGKAPEPYYDPMNFMIQQAHDRNMEFHAWLNLNRGTHGATRSVAPDHITRTKPEWFFTFSGAKVYDFGIPEVREYIVSVVRNIVRNYDVDGIHFDDYFYPYPVAGQKINDQATFSKYNRGFKNIQDWRRDNINLVVKAISDAIKEDKPWVKFGISPFGVWRSKDRDSQGSNTVGALSSYDDLYADSRLWAKEGWVDYTAPQIYFSFGHKTVPYKPITNWWIQNSGQRHLYMGLGSYRIGEKNKEWANASQIVRQVELNHSLKGVDGSIFYSSKSLMPMHHALSDSLKKTFAYPALQPTMPWKNAVPLPKPEIVELRRPAPSQAVIRWEVPESLEKNVHRFVIYRFLRGERRTLDDPRNIIAILPNSNPKAYLDYTIDSNSQYEYAITAIDRLHNESKPSKLHKLR